MFTMGAGRGGDCGQAAAAPPTAPRAAAASCPPPEPVPNLRGRGFRGPFLPGRGGGSRVEGCRFGPGSACGPSGTPELDPEPPDPRPGADFFSAPGEPHSGARGCGQPGPRREGGGRRLSLGPRWPSNAAPTGDKSAGQRLKAGVNGAFHARPGVLNHSGHSGRGVRAVARPGQAQDLSRSLFFTPTGFRTGISLSTDRADAGPTDKG